MSSAIFNKNGMFYIIGQIDESFDFGQIRRAADPLELHLAGVRNISSVGVRGFLVFMRSMQGRDLRFHACSEAFMDMLNTFSAILGDPARLGIVKSAMIIYRCATCAKDDEFLFEINYRPGELPTLPVRPCSRCLALLEPTIDSEDLFTYMLAGD